MLSANDQASRSQFSDGLLSEGFDAKAPRALVADGDFRRLAAHIANVVCVFGLGVGSQGDYLHTLPPVNKHTSKRPLILPVILEV
jgi:hypothetical protein